MIPIWLGITLMSIAALIAAVFLFWPKNNVPREVDGFALLGVTAVFVIGFLLTLCGVAEAVS